MVGILAEKPSAASNFAEALGGMQGSYRGTPYTIVSALGHLYEFLQPDEMVPPNKSAQYKDWNIANLPWDERDFYWRYCVRGDYARRTAKSDKNKQIAEKNFASANEILGNISRVLSRCDEICIATDVDPTGEGQLLAWEIISGLNLQNKRITRMYHQDEAAASVQKAFSQRKVLPPMMDDPEYIKALMRSQWDLLSMQWTRVATFCVEGKATLRQGRLKSAMVSIVGDGLKAIAEYKKIPYYQNRFRDENGNLFTSEKEPQFKEKKDVPQKYSQSRVIVDKRETKYTAPPALLDLAKLAAMLAPKGIRSEDVLSVYQKMYERSIVSYPRTEDKHITEEQFNDMLPLVDKIAAVVNVDPSILTHRTKRKTHVKPSGCAHGANRPGVNVPRSLEELNTFGSCAAEIYRILALNFLAMFCEDYEYEAQQGHAEAYPDFKGNASIPRKPGWKQIFSLEEEKTDDEEDTGKGLGNIASPIVYEGFPKKPPTPTMKWLMKELEKHDVGTGATRTSIYADVTSEKTRYPLLQETKGKISMTPYGAASYILLQGTHIGGVSITEQLMKDMRQVAAGTESADEILSRVKQLVQDDIVTMRENQAKAGEHLLESAVGQRIGTCPRCGKDVVEGKKGYGCIGFRDQPPCNFIIWKTNKLLDTGKKAITPTMAKALLKHGKCEVNGLVSAKGNTYGGLLELTKDDENNYKVQFRLMDDDEKSLGKCPRCGRPVLENKAGYGCTGFRDEDNPCRFFIRKTHPLLAKSEKTVTKSMVTNLLKEKKCRVTGLKSSGGKSYSCTLVMKDEGEYVNLDVVFDKK